MDIILLITNVRNVNHIDMVRGNKRFVKKHLNMFSVFPILIQNYSFLREDQMTAICLKSPRKILMESA